jgi:hypothetical protein
LSWSLSWESSVQEWNNFFMKLRSNPLSCEGQLIPVASDNSKHFSYAKDYSPGHSNRIKSNDVETGFDAYRSPLRASRDVFAQYIKGYARLWLSSIYRLPGIRRVAVSVFPEHRLHLLRRRLDNF